MGIAERKEREKEQRRNAIIDAAEKVFFTKGKDLSTMDDVAQEAELSKGTLYLYFKSKEELYLAITLRGLVILADMFEESVSNCKTGLEKVRAIGLQYYKFHEQYPDYFNALIYFESKLMDLNTEDSIAYECDFQGHESLEILTEALKAGIEDGSIRSDIDPQKASIVLWGQTTGLIQLISLKGEHLQKRHNVNMQEVIDYAFEMIYFSLKK